MKLNLGSGLKKLKGYINIDNDPLCNPDQIVDLAKGLLPFETNSVDEIVAHHILEHIGENFLLLMTEIYRVSKDGAVIDIVVPHHRHDNFYSDPTHVRPITVETMRMFGKVYAKHQQEAWQSWTGFPSQLNVDFELLDYAFIPDQDYMELVESGDFEQLHQLSKRFNNVYVETKIKLMVIKDE